MSFSLVHPLCYSSSYGKVYWKHGEERISFHENSHQNREAMVTMSMRRAGTGCMDCQLVVQFENEQRCWRKVLERAVYIIMFLRERSLPPRGDNEIVESPCNGNYLSVLEVLSNYDALLAEHIKRFSNKGKVIHRTCL